jgi:hypothetical protein
MPIFGTLGVPEVWRWSKGKLSFHVRDSRGVYRAAARSRSFPLISPSDLLPFVREAEKSLNLTPLLRRFRTWVRSRRAES